MEELVRGDNNGKTSSKSCSTSSYLHRRKQLLLLIGLALAVSHVLHGSKADSIEDIVTDERPPCPGGSFLQCLFIEKEQRTINGKPMPKKLSRECTSCDLAPGINCSVSKMGLTCLHGLSDDPDTPHEKLEKECHETCLPRCVETKVYECLNLFEAGNYYDSTVKMAECWRDEACRIDGPSAPPAPNDTSRTHGPTTSAGTIAPTSSTTVNAEATKSPNTTAGNPAPDNNINGDGQQSSGASTKGACYLLAGIAMFTAITLW